MNLIACVLLAPLLGFFAPSRRVVVLALTIVWALMLAPTAHAVLLVNQIDKVSFGNTLSFFAVNYAVLAVALFGADWLWRRRHSTAPMASVQTAR